MQPQNPGVTFPDDPKSRGRTPRCLSCGYRLVALKHPGCPECGRAFDPADPSSYTRRPPYVWYRYWWPGTLLTIGGGLAWSLAFYSAGQLGWGLFLGVPAMLGAVLGYHSRLRGRVGRLVGVLVMAASAITLVACLMAGGFAGLFCGIILLVFLIPVGIGGLLFGVLCARGLAAYLKTTAFSQREYLPLLIALLSLPGALHLAQRLLACPAPIESVQTSRTLDMGRGRAWNAWVFYEEVEHDPPLLLRLGLPNPDRVEGRIVAAGDQEVCVYTKDARLVKVATEVLHQERLAFDVVEQTNFENHSIRLINGAFDFQAVDRQHTRVTLTTRYEPLLRPRVLWRPIEQVTAQTLHRHVLEGMVHRDAERGYGTRMEPAHD